MKARSTKGSVEKDGSPAMAPEGGGGSPVDARDRTLFELAPDGLLIADAQGRYIDANPAVCRMLGYEHDTLVGLQASDIVAATELEHIAPAIDQIKSSSRYQREWIFLRKDGTTFEAEVLATMLPGGNLLAVVRDIADRRRAHEYQEHLAAIVASSSDAIIGKDLQGIISSWNAGAEAIFGYPGAEAIGMSIRTLIPDDLQAEEDAILARLRAGEKVPHFETRRRTRDGRIIDVSMTASPIRDASGRVVGASKIARDITDQKARERELQRLTRLYAALSQVNQAIVWSRSRGELLSKVCRALVDDGGFLMAWIGWHDPATEQLVPVAHCGDDSGYTACIRVFADDRAEGRGVTGMAFREGRTCVSNDLAGDPATLPWREEQEPRGLRSSAALPIRLGGEVCATLTVYSGETHFFREREITLLEEVAGDLSFGLDNEVREQERREAEVRIRYLSRVHAMLSGINALIVRVRSREDLFVDACRVAVEEGGFRMAMIAAVDSASGAIVPVASSGMHQDLRNAVQRVLASPEQAPRSMIARALHAKQTIVSNDSAHDPQLLLARENADAGVRSIVVLPLVVADEAVGAFVLYGSETELFHAEELELLRELAGDVAFAIDHLGKQERLAYLAYYDELTGLANRALFLDRMTQRMRSAAPGQRSALFLFDLERFRNINESLGRTAGDALLKQVGQWLTRNARDRGLLARPDSDHFAFVLPDVRADANLAGWLERTMERFSRHSFHLGGNAFRVAVRAGVALFPEDGDNADELLKNAEAALKQAKASGQRYIFYRASMNNRAVVRLTLENELRRALDNREFVLHYQPKVTSAGNQLTGAEALIRWNRRSTGLVAPGRFIPVLEEIGLIREVGHWALEQAMADYLRWRRAGLPVPPIAVNVSSLQLRDRGFAAEIEQLVRVDPAAAAGLQLEITESTLMEDIGHASATLQAMREIGVGIALDDFGTGFSSLSYLAKLPLNVLKIDRSFIHEMTLTPEGLSLVSSMISLAHTLGLKVVAEGVETEEQSRLLRLLRCDEMQGFLYSKPVPATDFESRFLARSSG